MKESVALYDLEFATMSRSLAIEVQDLFVFAL